MIERRDRTWPGCEGRRHDQITELRASARIARLWQPFAAWAFAANVDRRTEASIDQAGLELLDSRYVITDLIELMDIRVAHSP
jgi:hypothetical protein